MLSSKKRSYNFTDDRLHTLNCQAYLTKSGLRVFGFCPAGSTQRDFFRISPLIPGDDRIEIVVYEKAVAHPLATN